MVNSRQCHPHYCLAFHKHNNPHDLSSLHQKNPAISQLLHPLTLLLVLLGYIAALMQACSIVVDPKKHPPTAQVSAIHFALSFTLLSEGALYRIYADRYDVSFLRAFHFVNIYNE
ncbi:hypothetical protein K458DRAFT_384200 [Lentithecium fluviatile CBS 122367]|uniref:Uncharacterized protein n=1 Tax=Lentithecium fluviatile CBS 122367 TaxID=1168545 RepID=A0A6G1JGG9_9PLEO|nr:hypothetical protein K458DRAFT_384200 [Lentithecium fluviatile CBS 122367]